MIEWFATLTDNFKEKANYCSINIVQNEWFEDTYNFNQLSCQKSLLEKNYYAYRAKKWIEENNMEGGSVLTRMFNKVFCSFCS